MAQVEPVYRPPAAVGERFVEPEPLDPYRRTTREDVRDRWNEQIPAESTPADWRGGGGGSDPLLDAVWEGLASSAVRLLEGADIPTVEVQNGTLQDLRASAEDDPVYRVGEITLPTLVVRSSLDPTATPPDALALYDELREGHADREYVEISGGTHFLSLERRRTALYDAVHSFQNRIAYQ